MCVLAGRDRQLVKQLRDFCFYYFSLILLKNLKIINLVIHLLVFHLIKLHKILLVFFEVFNYKEDSAGLLL
jgi:hypothetical protein